MSRKNRGNRAIHGEIGPSTGWYSFSVTARLQSGFAEARGDKVRRELRPGLERDAAIHLAGRKRDEVGFHTVDTHFDTRVGSGEQRGEQQGEKFHERATILRYSRFDRLLTFGLDHRSP